MQKNNTRDSNVVPHRSTNLARQCLTSLSRREAVLSLWYGRSYCAIRYKINNLCQECSEGAEKAVPSLRLGKEVHSCCFSSCK
ncbi:hypothetical protein ACHAWT_003397 [Skeletonema menzelii]